MVETRYCRGCQCETIPMPNNHCGFCDRWLGKARTGSAGTARHMSEQQLVEAYKLYQGGMSTLEIGRQLLPATTYKSADSLASSIRYQWKERGWPVRGHSQASKIMWKKGDPEWIEQRKAMAREHIATGRAALANKREVQHA